MAEAECPTNPVTGGKVPPYDRDLAEELRSIAQNDYMIDGHYLDSGQILLAAARYIESKEDS